MHQAGRDENLARLTPPLHGPNPCDIEGWHFRNADNTGPNEAGDGNVNAPQREREFLFSPAVGVTIGGPDAQAAVSSQEVEAVGRFGRGTLTIGDYRLRGLEPGQPPEFAWMRYAAELSWLWRAAASP